MNLRICAKICKECPFSIGSAKGWLGPHDANDIVADMNRDLPFSCHLVRGDDEQENQEKMENGEHPICRGYVASATRSAKQFGQHPYYGKQMRELQKQITEEDENQVMNKWTFLKYHDEQ